jgi:hypothetical protein
LFGVVRFGTFIYWRIKMSRRLVPRIFYTVGDAFMLCDGSIVRIVEIDSWHQKYELVSDNSLVYRKIDQNNLWSMAKFGLIKYLGKNRDMGEADESSGKF